MYNLQLGDNLFVDINCGDLFIYRYDSDNLSVIKEVTKDYLPPVNEHTVEINITAITNHISSRSLICLAILSKML